MTGYTCARCGQPIDAARFDMYCAGCHDNVIAIAHEWAPEMASPEQRAALMYLYKHHGLHSRSWILGDLSERTGRNITDTRQVTAAEARLVLPQLTEWSYGK